jgi:prophage regulatory protein
MTIGKAERTIEPGKPLSDVSHAGTTAPRLIRLPELLARVGLKRSSIYLRMAQGRFPKSRSLGPRCAVWMESEVDDWIATVSRRVP